MYQGVARAQEAQLLWHGAVLVVVVRVICVRAASADRAGCVRCGHRWWVGRWQTPAKVTTPVQQSFDFSVQFISRQGCVCDCRMCEVGCGGVGWFSLCGSWSCMCGRVRCRSSYGTSGTPPLLHETRTVYNTVTKMTRVHNGGTADNGNERRSQSWTTSLLDCCWRTSIAPRTPPRRLSEETPRRRFPPSHPHSLCVM